MLEWSEIRLYDVSQLPAVILTALTTDSDYHKPIHLFDLQHAGISYYDAKEIYDGLFDGHGRTGLKTERAKLWDAALVGEYKLGDIIPQKYYIKQMFYANN